MPDAMLRPLADGPLQRQWRVQGRLPRPVVGSRRRWIDSFEAPPGNGTRRRERVDMGDTQGWSRRDLFRLAAAGGIAAATAGCALRRADATVDISPQEALRMLMEGNARFVGENMKSFDEDLSMIRQHVTEKQEPFAAVLSCADSRVPVEIVFDQSIGRLFVTRVAGNIVTPEIIGSLEYGAAVLGTKVILVLGHSNCGAVKATIQGKEVPGRISSLFPHIRPAVDQAGSNLEAVTQANAKIQAGLLRESSTVIAGLVKANSVKVVAGYYDLGTGVVKLLD